ncbi:hypothetical protein ACM66B_000826 [Microbotryomycetes sp. NB124-2]
MATAGVRTAPELRPRPSSQSLGQASTTDASSREYVSARSSLHSHDLDGSEDDEFERLRASAALPSLDTLSSSADYYADATFTQHDVSHMHDISAMSALAGLGLPPSHSLASFASRSTLSSEPHELLASSGIPPFVKSTTIGREDTARALCNKEKGPPTGPAHMTAAKTLRSNPNLDDVQVRTAPFFESDSHDNNGAQHLRARLPLRNVKPVGFPLSTSILATKLSLVKGHRYQSSEHSSSDNHGSGQSSHDGHRTSSDVDLDLSFDLPRPADLEGIVEALPHPALKDTATDLRAAFRAAEVKNTRVEEPAAVTSRAVAVPGSPQRPPMPRSLSSSPRMAKKLPAPLQPTYCREQSGPRFNYSARRSFESCDDHESEPGIRWQDKGKWKASQQSERDEGNMDVLEFVTVDDRDWKQAQAFGGHRGGFSPQTSPLFDGDSQGSIRTAPTTPNDTPIMPEHDHQAISAHADEEYQRLMKHKGPMHGLGFDVEPLSSSQPESKIPFVSVTAPADESDDDESGTEESAVDPIASPSRRLSNRLSRLEQAAPVTHVVRPEMAALRERKSARFDQQPRHLLRSETMPGARLPHEKAADARFAFKPVPLQLVVDHCPPSQLQTATTHAHAPTRSRARPLSVVSLLDLASYPSALFDETRPAKMTLWLGFLLGPWLWIIGGWYLRSRDGEVPGTQGFRCNYERWMGLDKHPQQSEQHLNSSHQQPVPATSSTVSRPTFRISTSSWLSKHGNGTDESAHPAEHARQQIGHDAQQRQHINSADLPFAPNLFAEAVAGRATAAPLARDPNQAPSGAYNTQTRAMNPHDMHMYAQPAYGNAVAYSGYGTSNGGGADLGAPAGRATRKGRPVIKDSEEEDEDEDAEGEADQPYEAPAGDLPMDEASFAAGKAPEDEDDDFKVERPKLVPTLTKSGRKTLRPAIYDGDSSDDDDEPVKPARSLRRGRNKSGYGDGNGFVEPDDDDFNAEDAEEDEEGDYGLDRKAKMQRLAAARRAKDEAAAARNRGRRSTRSSAKVDQSYEAEDSPQETTEDDVDLEISSDDSLKPAAPRKLREKPKIDYYNIPPVESLTNNKSKKKRKGDDPFAGLPHNLTGAQWAALYPDKNNNGDSSSSDDDGPGFGTPRKGGMFSSNPALAGLGAGGGMFAGGAGLDLGAPSNLGKVGGSASLADTDPLGVSQVSFDSVGGLGSHIQQLKEMVSLPLLYPEVFERFNMSPPRGVLFHGPPGTGKTLLARALAASCSTDGRKIAFFMRKGADCLSKWVGEAERQLRLLFEEAKKCQPSIIFFDEIDGLAPVRSSKQEQIHASIVSTLLALMDGMDGRGQVIVIGATNRPDAIDPALRRPGRFDREFYFPLPNIEGRRKIIDIHTKGWNPPLEDDFKDELAHLTKGYGGADLRALCTEAALNAVQRTFPQIYKTNDRLLIKPEKIEVTARDFIVSQKNLIPSTARATSSLAAPLPVQLEPLLSQSLETAKAVLAKVLPEAKKVNVLEDAEWEDDGGGFEKEKMMQAFETLRVFRPRLLIHGGVGMGQSYVGSAVLHHLEGFHVQPLDLATLVADSTRTMEAACVQLFVEAKRHKPSILFIPSLITWCHSVGDSVKSTIKGLLDGLDPSDPILLLAVVDGPLSEVPGDVRSWFGFVKGNRVAIGQSTATQRGKFFDEVIKSLQRPPNEFPDAMPRRKRVLEKLPIAPPPPPKVPTEAEIKAQEEADLRLSEFLKFKLGPILNELKKRFKRFTRSFFSDWRNDDLVFRMDQQKREVEIVGLGTQPYFNVDLDTMHSDLYKGYYFTPDDFLADVLRIQANVEVNAILEHDNEAPVRAAQMLNHARIMIEQVFDPNFRAECAKMRERAEERDKKLPPGAKSKVRKIKSKGPLPGGDDLHAYAVAAAAAGGKGLMGTIKKPSEVGGGDQQADGDAGADPNRVVKRVRIQDDDDAANMDEGPSKRARNDVNGVSTSSGMRVNFVLNGAPALSTGVVPEPAVAAPMQVGAAPEDALGLDMPPLPTLPDASAPALPSHIASNVGASTSALRASTPRQGTPQPGRLATPDATANGPASVVASSPAGMSDAPMPPATPEPLPDFVVPARELAQLAATLKDGTAELTVDELEQMRAACFDVVWRGRKEWDRGQVVQEVYELVTEFVAEAREAKEFA